jgi:hypothetical protein
LQKDNFDGQIRQNISKEYTPAFSKDAENRRAV